MAAVVLVLAAAVIVFAIAVARAEREPDDGERKRLEAMDERRAAANLYEPERRLEVVPQGRRPKR